jgi:ankyrin repeat protein
MSVLVVLLWQGHVEALLFFAACDSRRCVTMMLDEFGVDKDAMVPVGICLDCEPACIVELCAADEHEMGSLTALMAACSYGSRDVVALLCDRGVNVNKTNEVGDDAGVSFSFGS